MTIKRCRLNNSSADPIPYVAQLGSSLSAHILKPGDTLDNGVTLGIRALDGKVGLQLKGGTQYIFQLNSGVTWEVYDAAEIQATADPATEHQRAATLGS